MNTIPAQELKKRGIKAVEEIIKDGPVHVIRNNKPQYVVLSEEQYGELVETRRAAYVARVQASLQDAKKGRVHKFKDVDAFLKAIEKDE